MLSPMFPGTSLHDAHPMWAPTRNNEMSQSRRLCGKISPILTAAVLTLGSAACSSDHSASRPSWEDPPAEVVASFEDFVNRHLPVLEEAARKNGYHLSPPEWREGSEPWRTNVSAIAESRASVELYAANLFFILEREALNAFGSNSSEIFDLRFQMHGREGDWLLILENGYPWELLGGMWEDGYLPRQPLDLIVGVRNTFDDRIEIRDWLILECFALAEAEALDFDGSPEYCSQVIEREKPPHALMERL